MPTFIIVSTVEQLNQTLVKLPAPQQLEVLHFAEFLATRQPDLSDSQVEDASRPVRFRVVTSPVTGLPVIETDGPPITSEMVRELLADFP